MGIVADFVRSNFEDVSRFEEPDRYHTVNVGGVEYAFRLSGDVAEVIGRTNSGLALRGTEDNPYFVLTFDNIRSEKGRKKATARVNDHLARKAADWDYERQMKEIMSAKWQKIFGGKHDHLTFAVYDERAAALEEAYQG